jgi:hypothetical protein
MSGVGLVEHLLKHLFGIFVVGLVVAGFSLSRSLIYRTSLLASATVALESTLHVACSV